jgi:uncharacterized membrane protein
LGVGNSPVSESTTPVGITIVGGLLFSQICTVSYSGILHTYMEDWRKQLESTKNEAIEFFWRPEN